MEYVIHLLIISGIFSILAISLNLVVGYTGLVSVAHAAFYGIGAYATAVILKSFDLNFFLTLSLAILITAFVALLFGLVLSKFKDDYYVLASVGFNIIVFGVFLNWRELTRGPLGIPGIPRPNFEFVIWNFEFYSNFSFLLLTLTFLLLTYLLARFIVNSSFGRVLKAIREDEIATKIFGYNTPLFKLSIFVIAAGKAAIAGGLYASFINFI